MTVINLMRVAPLLPLYPLDSGTADGDDKGDKDYNADEDEDDET